MTTLCEIAKQDKKEVDALNAAARAKYRIANTTKALECIHSSLGVKLKANDLNWNDEEAYYNTATFILEDRKFFVSPTSYNEPWRVTTWVEHKRVERRRKDRLWGLLATREYDEEVTNRRVTPIRRPSDLIEAGICNG